MSRFGPRSLAGQLALVIAAALFVGQAINFALFLAERRHGRIEQVTTPAVTRIADALEREAGGRPIRSEGGRIQRVAQSPIPAGAVQPPGIADPLRQALAETGVRAGAIALTIIPIAADDPRLRHMPDRRRERLLRDGRELLVAVEQPGHGWLVTRVPWPRGDRWIVGRLITQTFIIYIVVLVPVLLATRRISRPLRELATAARGFRAGADDRPLEPRGPQDVRDVIAAYNALKLRVTAMLDEKDHMLGAIAHDLRTPLAALRVRIELVEDETDRTRMADTIEEMNRTLDDILSLARLGRPSEPPVEVDVSALVDAVVEDFRDLGRDVTFVEAPRLPLRLRPVLMRRAVRNLIENAVKYGHCAEVSVASTADQVAIAVLDKGPGIPPDRLGDVFDAFTRLETSRNRETGGIGLGLALARAIVREAGGEIVLANRAEGGLAATITLPRVPR